MESEREVCKRDLKKLKGLPPYNDISNICWGDHYFGKYIYDKYPEQMIESVNKELDKEFNIKKGPKINSWQMIQTI